MKKKNIIISVICFIILIIIILWVTKIIPSIMAKVTADKVVFDDVHQTSMIDDKTPSEPIKSTKTENSPITENIAINWDEITTEGVDEQKLIENINTDDLEKIATLLQNLESEIAEKEKEDFKFVFEAKWYEYTLNSEQFNHVLNMGNNALKPLYLIIYKSPNQGLYEYICCMAIQKITNYQIEDWNNSKSFLNNFNKFICDNREI